ncbi:MAG TPA: hypothetical protein PLX54_08665 [Candidatus Fermentibacter daniensis]|nr:hypothetical protein [Candidatus Fermentibacter daniensis]HOR06437.1 hypothetical protein [Candidatus Fermentibacter daniensis]HPK52426.1 hypothetical protein [Candidatus Fermentibacter daniensis]
MKEQRSTGGSEGQASRVVPLAILIAVACSLLTFHPYPYDHVVSRWALVRQLVDAGTMRIDPYGTLMSDKSEWLGHFYSDKSALLSLACVPPAGLAAAAGIGSEGSIPLAGFDPARFFCERLLVSGALLALLLLIRRRLRRESTDPLPAVVAIGLGSILLPYSTVLYSHVPAAALLFAGYCLQKESRFRASDICCALAASMDYTVILPFIVLVAFRPRAWWRPSGVLTTVLITAAAFIPQMAYNRICFGNPFRMGYSLEASDAFEGIGSGFFGFTVPTAGQLLYLLFSPERGLFFYMPWIVPGLGGLVARDVKGRLRIDPGLPAVLVYILLYSALHTRTQGWAFGPRYLIPVVPFAALGLSRFAARGARERWAAAFLVIPGILQAFLGLFGEMHLPVHPVEQAVPLPQYSISLRMLLDGHHSMWLAGTIGVAVVLLISALVAAALFRGGRFSPASLLAVPILLALALSSLSQDWGGRIDYYRGVLAEHRMEYGLAATYYARAAQDPTAPPVVSERAARCGFLSAPGSGLRGGGI